MEEKSIIKLAFVVVVLGLGFLFLYAEEFSLAVVEDLETAEIEEEVHLRGKVTGLRVTEKATFLEVEGEKIVKSDVILFPEEEVYLHEGDYVDVYGEVEEYEGKKEVIGSKIVVK